MFTRNLLFISFLAIQSFAYAGEKSVLNIERWQTNHGAKVYFVQTPEIPMIQINVVFNAGSSRDNNQAGLSQFTNGLLNEGTKDLTATQIAEQFDKVGAEYSANVDKDMATVSLQSLTESQYLTPALNTFTEVLTTPIFSDDAIARVRNQILSAIQSQKQSPKSTAINLFYQNVFKNTPYQFPTNGTAETIQAIKKEDLINFYKKYYVTQNALITIVGAIDAKQAHLIAEQITRNLPVGQAATSLPLLNKTNTQDTAIKVNFPSEQTTILTGQIGINYQNPYFFPLYVGNYILGGTAFSSRLFNEVREKQGLTYNVNSIFKPLAANGPFVIMLQTRNSESQKSVDVVTKVLNEFIQQGPTEAELVRTKKQIINEFPLSLAGNDAISNYLIMLGFYQLPKDYLDTYRDKVNQVTASQIKEAFQKTIHPNGLTTILVGKN